MKTTIDIADSLLQEAKKISSMENTTVRALVEEGLREAINKHKSCGTFKLRKATFKGKGLQSDFSPGQWNKISSTAYEGRGG
jgi:hypothetical protein